jgi:CubicO group peptidase (beta-lactamase class C family)
MKQLLILCLNLSALSAFSQSNTTTRIDSLLSSWKSNEPGGVVAIIKDHEVIYKKAFGLSDMSARRLNTVDTKFDLASDAKQFTAMAIALLEEQGKLSVDDQLQNFYPHLKITQPITIANLLAHSSGLREASVLAILSGKMNLKGEVRRKYNTKEYYLECLMRETDLNFDPGSELAYTNFNYILLADIVQKISGQSFSRFCDSAIFKPLGMSNTHFREKRKQVFENEAKGYLFTGKKFKERKGLGGILGDHNIISTVDDLVKWQLNFYDNKLGNKQASLIEKITKPFALNNGESSHYAYGLWSVKYRGLTRVSHGGDDGRHTSIMLNFPETRTAIIVLANSSRYWDTEEKAFRIADILLERELKEPLPPAPVIVTTHVADSILKKHARLYTRVDERGLAALLKITFDNGKLFVTRNIHLKGLELKPIDENHFVATNPLGYTIKFRFPTDSSGYVVEQYRSNPQLIFKEAKSINPEFRVYKGKFRNASTGAVITVKNKKNKIIAKKGIIRIPLMPFDTDQFYAYDNDALFTFSRTNGKIDSLKVNAWDFRNFTLDRIR